MDKETEQQQAENKQFIEMKRWIASCRDFNKDFYGDLKELRGFAAGNMDIDDGEDGLVRANLFHSTLQALIPVIYSRNPDFSIGPSEGVEEEELQAVKGFAKAISICVSRALREAKLKKTAKACVRGAMTSRLAWIKITYQRNYDRDPVIQNRIEDAQDNLLRLNKLTRDLEDQEQAGEHELIKQQLEQTLQALNEQVEVIASEGIVIDRVEPEHIYLDPAITSLEDWQKSRRIIQEISMPKSQAEEIFGKKLDKASTFSWSDAHKQHESGKDTGKFNDPLVKVFEIWDKQTMTVYTLVDGYEGFVREPFIPERQPEQWYPFFMLSFFPVDGRFLPLSMVELLKELVDEYNASRTQLAEHRALSIPHWIADKGTDRDSLERKRDSVMGEIVLVDAQGRPLNQVIEPAAPPPFNPAIYDTTPVLRDIDMISGVPDAQRAAIGRQKTLGEAEIMQQGAATRSSEIQDIIEDWMQEIATATAEILLQELTPMQVARIAGRSSADYWPTMDKRDVFDKVNIDIKAGTTGKPNKESERKNWEVLFPLIMQLQDIIAKIEAAGGNADYKRELLKETLRRFDERIDVDMYLPPKPQQQMIPGAGTGVMQPIVQ